MQLPNSQANLTATMTNISPLKPLQLEIRRTSEQVTDTLFVTLECSSSEPAQDFVSTTTERQCVKQ